VQEEKSPERLAGQMGIEEKTRDNPGLKLIFHPNKAGNGNISPGSLRNRLNL